MVKFCDLLCLSGISEPPSSKVHQLCSFLSFNRIQWFFLFLFFVIILNMISRCVVSNIFLLYLIFKAQSPLLPHCGGVDVHFTGMMDCFKQVIKTKGVLSLWSGITANTLKVTLLYVCIYFFTMLDFLNPRILQTTVTLLLSLIFTADTCIST